MRLSQTINQIEILLANCKDLKSRNKNDPLVIIKDFKIFCEYSDNLQIQHPIPFVDEEIEFLGYSEQTLEYLKTSSLDSENIYIRRKQIPNKILETPLASLLFVKKQICFEIQLSKNQTYPYVIDINNAYISNTFTYPTGEMGFEITSHFGSYKAIKTRLEGYRIISVYYDSLKSLFE